MISTTLSRRHPGYLGAVCFTAAALALGMSLPGCVKSPREFLSSLREQKIDEEESGAIADASDAESELKTAQVSRAEKDAKLPQDDVHSRNLIDRLLSRKQEDASEGTSDPFIESDEALRAAKQQRDEVVAKADAEVEQRAKTLEELLAQSKPSTSLHSSETDSSSTVRDDDGQSTSTTPGRGEANLFASGFDSRLERLKADLQREPSRATENVNPFAEFVAGNRSQESAASEVDPGPVKSVSFERKADGRTWADSSMTAETPSARERVLTLLKQAHEDWDSWKLEEAYRKALAAQELAVLERVEFDVSDERPADLAKRIASDIRKDSLASTATKVDPWSDEPQPKDDLFGQAASEAFSSFTSGTSTIGWQAAAPERKTELQQLREQPHIPESSSSSKGNSGVNLLPPSGDDFPSEAEGLPWQSSASSESTDVRRRGESSQAIVNLAWPDESDSHRSGNDDQPGDRPTLVGFDTDAVSATTRSKAEESQELLAHAEAARNRVLQSDSPRWPTLPAPSTSNRSNQQSEELAVAAPILLGVNDHPASTVAAGTRTTASLSTSHAADAPSGSRWFSRPLWFVGGLLLLMLAMRLLSRRSSTLA